MNTTQKITTMINMTTMPISTAAHHGKADDLDPFFFFSFFSAALSSAPEFGHVPVLHMTPIVVTVFLPAPNRASTDPLSEK